MSALLLTKGTCKEHHMLWIIIVHLMLKKTENKPNVELTKL